MPAGEGVGGDAGLVQRGVRAVFDENVGGFQQVVEGVDAVAAGGVQGYAAFALVDEQEQPAAFGMGNVVGMGPQRRAGSPSGGSTLMTSAPRSASSLAQNGAETISPHSTTRMPSRGPGGVRTWVGVDVPCLAITT